MKRETKTFTERTYVLDAKEVLELATMAVMDEYGPNIGKVTGLHFEDDQLMLVTRVEESE